MATELGHGFTLQHRATCLGSPVCLLPRREDHRIADWSQACSTRLLSRLICVSVRHRSSWHPRLRTTRSVPLSRLFTEILACPPDALQRPCTQSLARCGRLFERLLRSSHAMRAFNTPRPCSTRPSWECAWHDLSLRQAPCQAGQTIGPHNQGLGQIWLRQCQSQRYIYTITDFVISDANCQCLRTRRW